MCQSFKLAPQLTQQILAQFPHNLLLSLVELNLKVNTCRCTVHPKITLCEADLGLFTGS